MRLQEQGVGGMNEIIVWNEIFVLNVILSNFAQIVIEGNLMKFYCLDRL